MMQTLKYTVYCQGMSSTTWSIFTMTRSYNEFPYHIYRSLENICVMLWILKKCERQKNKKRIIMAWTRNRSLREKRYVHGTRDNYIFIYIIAAYNSKRINLNNHISFSFWTNRNYLGEQNWYMQLISKLHIQKTSFASYSTSTHKLYRYIHIRR